MASLHDLTEAELKVLDLMAQGRANGEIATDLGVGVRTVESHVSSILLKLGLAPDSARDRRVSAVLIYMQRTRLARSTRAPVPA